MLVWMLPESGCRVYGLYCGIGIAGLTPPSSLAGIRDPGHHVWQSSRPLGKARLLPRFEAGAGGPHPEKSRNPGTFGGRIRGGTRRIRWLAVSRANEDRKEPGPSTGPRLGGRPCGSLPRIGGHLRVPAEPRRTPAPPVRRAGPEWPGGLRARRLRGRKSMRRHRRRHRDPAKALSSPSRSQDHRRTDRGSPAEGAGLYLPWTESLCAMAL